MKRLLAVLLVFLIVFSCSACSFTSNDVNNDIGVEATPSVEYYSNTSVPTLDSLLDENEIQAGRDYPLYGPYESTDEALLVIAEYSTLLVEKYGFERLSENELTNGTETVTMYGGAYQEKIAIAVIVE